MATEILMPALSPTMEEGTLAKWLVKEGDTVSAGDILAEIETDKATMEFEAVDEGTIGKLLVAEGAEGVKVNTPIAVLLEEGESASDIAAPSQPAPKAGTADAGAKAAPAGGPAAPAAAPATAAEAGPEAPRAAMPVGPSADAVARMYEGRAYEEVKLDGMRRTVAARLTEAKQTIPHFYLRREVQIDALLKFRAELNAGLEARGVKLSVNDFIIKACAMALQDVPDANAVWAGDRILRLKPSDVAVAVAIEGGLFTPVLKDAHLKSLSALSAEMKDLATRARNRKLAPHEYVGGSMAISNLGMYGIDNFDAVINPPHGSILAVGAGVKKPVVGRDGELAVATVMSMTLSVDHRVIDGALGADFLKAVIANLENPLAMLA